MKLQAVLFDLDGTLLDSAPDFIAVTNAMLQKRGLPSVEEQKLRQAVSGGAKDMVSIAFKINQQHPEFEPLRIEFLERYLTHCVVYSKLYKGIKQLLIAIEQIGLPWGVVTNKPSRFAEPIVKQLLQNSSVLVCPEHVTHCKPSPEPLLLASKQLALAPEHIIYVGDDQRDIDSGNAAGCYTIAVNYGYIHPDDDPKTWQANAFVSTVAELKNCIEQLLELK